MTLPKFLRLSKRQRFVIATIVLLAGIMLIRVGLGEYLQWRYRVPLFAFVSLLVTIWAVRDEDFNGIEWLMLPILPTLFAIGAALVNPLLPTRIDNVLWFAVSTDASTILVSLIKFIFLSLFITGYYATLLTVNIFNVAAEKGIQLLRVAHSIGFLVTVATGLLLYLVIGSFHLMSFLNMGVVAVVTFFLALQAFWSVNLEKKLDKNIIIFSAITGGVVGEVAWILSFWPVSGPVYALFLTAIFYELLGIIQYHLGEKLNKKVANEFIVVAIVVFVLTILTTTWN